MLLYFEFSYNLNVTDPNKPGDISILPANIMTTSLKISWGPVESGELQYYEVEISPKEPQTQSPMLVFNENIIQHYYLLLNLKSILKINFDRATYSFNILH